MGKKDRNDERRQREADRNAKSDREAAEMRETIRQQNLEEARREREERGKR